MFASFSRRIARSSVSSTALKRGKFLSQMDFYCTVCNLEELSVVNHCQLRFTCINFRLFIAAAVHTNGYQENASSDSKIMASVAIAAGVSIIFPNNIAYHKYSINSV